MVSKKERERLRRERLRERQQRTVEIRAKLAALPAVAEPRTDASHLAYATMSTTTTSSSPPHLMSTPSSAGPAAAPLQVPLDISNVLSSVFGGEGEPTPLSSSSSSERVETAASSSMARRVVQAARRAAAAAPPSAASREEEGRESEPAYVLEPLREEVSALWGSGGGGVVVGDVRRGDQNVTEGLWGKEEGRESEEAQREKQWARATVELKQMQEKMQQNQQPSSVCSRKTSRSSREGDNDEDDDVVLPKLASSSSSSAAGRACGSRQQEAAARRPPRKQTKMSWDKLKLAVLRRYGVTGLEVVEPHDGNAEDPLFTVRMKLTPRGSVPVPRHWDKLRPFLSHQADREAAAVVPVGIQLLGVDKIRAAKDHHRQHAANPPDQIAFMTCFLTGTPLQRQGFGVAAPSPFLCRRIGDLFYEGKWLAKPMAPAAAALHRGSSVQGGGGGDAFLPGPLSSRLREALGMSSATSPPPWLYAMQALRRLPPAYPQLRVPGLNAPIPAGAHWGSGVGQWGASPRAEDNSFLFPGVMDEAAEWEVKQRLRHHGKAGGGGWGVVPPLASAAEEAMSVQGQNLGQQRGSHVGSGGSAGTRPQDTAYSSGPHTPTANTTAMPRVTPVAFVPKTFAAVSQQQQQQQQQMVSSSGPLQREFVPVVSVSSAATTTAGVTVGHTMVAAGAGGYPPPPPPGTAAAPAATTTTNNNAGHQTLSSQSPYMPQR